MPHQLLHEFDQLQHGLQAAIVKRQDVDDLIALLDEATCIRERINSVVTDNAHIRDELTLRHRALDAAPTHFSIAKYASETESIFIYVNRAFAEAHGRSPEELIGCSSKDLAPFDWTPQRYQEIRATLAAGKEARGEGQLRRKDGSSFWIGITIIPVHDANGTLTHTVSLAADITSRRENERKQRELQQQLLDEMQQREHMSNELRLAQKLESIGRLAAGVAHEINTPIQFVTDSLYFLRSAFHDINNLLDIYRQAEGRLSAGESVESFLKTVTQATAAADLDFLAGEIPKAFERTFDGTNRVTNIVRAMKEFAHPDGSEQNPSDINHALQTTLIVAANEYKYLATVTTQFAELPMVNCNINELNQVFLNLIVNAAHAIHDSGKDAISGNISITTQVINSCVEIIIADNGCGIPEAHLDKIYDPFFTTKEVGRGTGQGLAIARSIVVEKHGGDIRVNSSVGTGTQFTLCLPINGQSSGLKETML